MQVVVFRLGSDEYALPVERVREIVAYRPPRRLPNAGTGELGVISLRDEIVSVWDLTARLGLPPRPADEQSTLVRLDAEPPVALVVGEVVGIRDTAEESIEPLPHWPAALGIVHAGEKLVVVLDADRLLGRAEPSASLDKPGLDEMPKGELQRLAREAGIAGRSTMDRAELIAALLRG